MFCSIFYIHTFYIHIVCTSKDRRESPLERKNMMTLSPSAVQTLIFFYEEKSQTEVTADEVRSKRNVERNLRRRIESLQHKLRLRTRQLRNAVNRNCKQETRYDEICERVNASMKNSEFTCKEAEIALC